MNRNRPAAAPIWHLSLAALALLAGCSSLGGGSRPADEVGELQRQVTALRRQATVDKIEVARLRQEIAQLEAELAAARGGAPRTAPPPSASRSGSPAPRPATPPVLEIEEIEEVDPEPIVDDTPEIEETELEEPPRRAPAPAPVEEPLPPDASEPAQAAEPATPEALRLYDAGYTLFHQKRFVEAEQQFRRYLELYPRTELADNAQFWVGECFYARGDFHAALAAYTATVERYPEGNKVPDALLKAGRCLESLGKRDQARETYQEILTAFPASSAAAAARERLAALP